MRIALTQFVSLDGVSQGPGAPDEDPSDGFRRGGWFAPYVEDYVPQASEWLDLADGLLFGRRTYEAFARDWPQMTDPDDVFAGRMNALPKYVVTTTLAEGAWNPTTVLKDEPARVLADLKRRPGRELQVHGSARLSAWLLSAGLVDVMRLVVAPVVVGEGRRLLAHPIASDGFRLVRHDALPSGVMLLEYERLAGWRDAAP